MIGLTEEHEATGNHGQALHHKDRPAIVHDTIPTYCLHKFIVVDFLRALFPDIPAANFVIGVSITKQHHQS